MKTTAVSSLSIFMFSSRWPRALGLEKRQELSVDLVLECRAHAVRRAFVNLETCILDQLGGKHRGSADRNDLIVVAVYDQRRHVDLFEILGEVRFRKGFDAVVGGVQAT